MKRKIYLKVCGMRDPENILQVAELKPDYMGFIFYPKSKRFVGSEFKVPDQLSKSIKRVGVFVNESTDTIIDLANRHGLDFIQLHGEESVNQCAELRHSGLGIIKAFSIDEQSDFLKVVRYKEVADYFLFDTKSEGYGGTGKAFDWNLLHHYDQDVPFFLSGGVSSANIHTAKNLAKMNLHAFDVNSGVELSPGLKAVDKLEELNLILNLKF